MAAQLVLMVFSVKQAEITNVFEAMRVFSGRDLRKLLIPLIIEQVLMSFMGMADTMMVSNVGEAALSAVSLADSINVLVINLFAALATGGTIICAQYIGNKNDRAAHNASNQVMLSVIAISLMIMTIGIVLRKPLLRAVFGAVEDDVMSNALIYFTITVVSYPFIAIHDASAALFRSTGNSKLPMLVTMGVNVLNIAGNAVLIFIFKLGVMGAAIPTLVSRMVGAIIMLSFQHRAGQVISFRDYRHLRPDFKVIKRVLAIGVPTGIENCFFQLGKLMVQSTVSTLGTQAIAAQAMTSTLELFISQPAMAVGLGMVTVVGQCIGAGKKDEAKKYIKKLTIIATVILVALEVLVLAATKPITMFATMTADGRELTFRLMCLIVIVKTFLWPMAFMPAYGMRAAGDVKFSMIVSTTSMWILRVALSWYLCRFTDVGILGVWIGMFSDWFARNIFFIWRLKSGRWIEHKVIER